MTKSKITQGQQLNLFQMPVAKATPAPFLKWPGGKRSLLDDLRMHAPTDATRYIAPCLGGGAPFFMFAQSAHLEEFIISDLNIDLMVTYQAVKHWPEALIARLHKMQQRYWPASEAERKAMYYEVRQAFNDSRPESYDALSPAERISRAARLIFLNKTGFNGLYRVNMSGKFNVAHGRYKKPGICNEMVLRAAHIALGRAKLFCGDFEHIESLVDEDSFVYIDPPYRPISSTANFTSYTASGFDETDQVRLAQMACRLSELGARVMLSNADIEDDFYTTHYQEFKVVRVMAHRQISVKASTRGQVSEVLIKNYD